MAMRRLVLAAGACGLGLLLGLGCSASGAWGEERREMVTATPRETDELLANPGMGWQTFYRLADEDPNLAGLPSGAAYIRFYWRQLEPEEGKIDFALLDDLLAHGRRVGQKLGFRVMVAATGEQSRSGAPDWLREKGCPGFEYMYGSEGPYWVPDFEAPMFKEAHYRLIRELGKRYNGHPDVDYVDIGSVGLWGEWHMSGTGLDVPSLGTRLEIVDEYLKAFPDTPKLMLIGDADCMRQATSSGCGWRADCLGDMGGFSPDWNHMRDMYPAAVAESGSADAWKKAPVAWETCWDMRKWVEEGWDIRHIFDYALEYHASYVNNKSAPIPEGARGEVERLLVRLGYRLVLRSAEHEAGAGAGGGLTVKMRWENVGVAPPYRDYRLAFRLTDAAGRSEVVVTTTSIKGWLPGEIAVTEQARIPEGMAKGKCQLAVGLVDAATKAPAVKLAIEGRDGEGWYGVSAFAVE